MDQSSHDKPPPYSPYYSQPTYQQTVGGQTVGGGYPATQAYHIPGQAHMVQPQGYGSTIVVHQQPEVIIIGGCPVCRIGSLEEDFTCLGVLIGILLFPLGLICCLAMRNKRCTHCGITFD